MMESYDFIARKLEVAYSWDPNQTPMNSRLFGYYFYLTECHFMIWLVCTSL
jgi:hypothetical protein